MIKPPTRAHSSMRSHLLFCLCTVFLFACASAELQELDASKHRQAKALLSLGFINLTDTPTLTLTLTRNKTRGAREKTVAPDVFVFIEGDGAPWSLFGTRPPSDPTPRRSIALDLARTTAIKSPASVLYVARPCQFLAAATFTKCATEAWASKRYSNEQLALLLSSTEQGLKSLGKNTLPSLRIILVGHSGGGVMAIRVGAALIRGGHDVVGVVTLASPIDPITWSENHRFSALDVDTYYNDMDLLAQGQVASHYVGKNDKLVGLADTRERYRDTPKKISEVAGVEHVAGWLEYWEHVIFDEISDQTLDK